jgi:hypothetical protein
LSGWLRDLRGCLRILESLVERHFEDDVGVLRWMGSAVWRRHPPTFSANLPNPSQPQDVSCRRRQDRGNEIDRDEARKEGRKEGRREECQGNWCDTRSHRTKETVNEGRTKEQSRK